MLGFSAQEGTEKLGIPGIPGKEGGHGIDIEGKDGNFGNAKPAIIPAKLGMEKEGKENERYSGSTRARASNLA